MLTLALVLNGEVLVPSLAFASTGSLSTFALTASSTVHLLRGSNRIALRSASVAAGHERAPRGCTTRPRRAPRNRAPRCLMGGDKNERSPPGW